MKTRLSYYCILFVYISLWSCQLIACHLTHSLIILTDSYINLYRILDISLGILHLSTQQTLTKNRAKLNEAASKSIASKSNQTPAYKFLNSIDTFQYRRLPLLGSFVNGIFLAALLMSAAIEGLQTCFHVKHSENRNQKTILTENAATYPSILAGFAIVGLVMQYCSLKAHQMRDEELCSESLLDLRAEQARKRANSKKEASQQVSIKIKELDANGLLKELPTVNSGEQFDGRRRRSYEPDSKASSGGSPADRRHSAAALNCAGPREFAQGFQASELPNDETKQVSLRSMRFPVNVTSDTKAFDTQICFHGLNLDGPAGGGIQSSVTYRSSSKRDNWFYVRCLASPIAMLICATIFYLVDIELMTEIADAALAVSVVFLLFAASFPPMRKAGKILLQTVPDGVDIKRLQLELERCSRDGDIIQVKDLHVWSLTPRTNRVATCRLILDKNNVINKAQVERIVAEAKFRFLDQRIECTTIEPVLVERRTRGVVAPSAE